FNILYETSIKFVPKEPRLAETASINYNNPNPIRPFIAKSVNNPDLPTAVFFRDSFIIALIPFLSEHYNRSVYPWVRYNQTIIEMESPDIVVTEIIERNLGRI
ncbi:MAG: hypothetical protein U9Q22_02325, partial [Candidatus Altiarchaeota archaeon]|nr:hypothetical protein [Candidatus Altiarchaeota archaeon]